MYIELFQKYISEINFGKIWGSTQGHDFGEMRSASGDTFSKLEEYFWVFIGGFPPLKVRLTIPFFNLIDLCG